uniref:Uncharacterized protein n=1 Tax=Tetradesmus obliquus TaxID=3088 RepID=A0A383VNG5_TETOB|eukprot:jgi/Sobl393_1/9152/SZX67065.1
MVAGIGGCVWLLGRGSSSSSMAAEQVLPAAAAGLAPGDGVDGWEPLGEAVDSVAAVAAAAAGSGLRELSGDVISNDVSELPSFG